MAGGGGGRTRRPKLGGGKTNPNKIPLGVNKVKFKKKTDNNNNNNNSSKKSSKKEKKKATGATETVIVPLSVSEQLKFFLNQFQSSNAPKLSSLELESIKDTCIVKLSEGLDQDIGDLSGHMKAAFGVSWKEELCEGKLLEGKIDPGSPSILVISISAIRSLELLRGLRPLTGECRAAKLFAKHMKVEEQVAVLKNRVNIASGTPSRIKKLIDMDALGLSRLSVVVLDMHTDAKGYSLFTLPQVSGEFWDLYTCHFHHRLVQGDLRICLYGPVSRPSEIKATTASDE